MHEPSSSTIIQTAVGLTAATFPWWSHVVSIITGIDQFLLGLGGLVALGFTIWKLVLEIRVARKKLREGE